MGDGENYNVEEDISISKEPVYLKNKRLKCKCQFNLKNENI